MQNAKERQPRRGSLLGMALLLAAALSAPALAEEPAPPADPGAAPAAAEAAAHEALRQLRAVYQQAINQRQPKLLEPHLDEEFSGVMVTGELVKDFASLAAYWENLQQLIGPEGSYSTELEPDLSWIHGDIAVAKGSSRDVVVTGGGREFRFTTQWTAVLVKRESGWKLRRIQGTMDPVRNPFVAAAAKQSGLVGGAAGLAIGLLVGALSRYLRQRKAS